MTNTQVQSATPERQTAKSSSLFELRTRRGQMQRLVM